VTATDPVEAFVSAAQQAGSADKYKVATAANLPFADATCDLAIAYNVLMDVENVPMALREIRLVLDDSHSRRVTPDYIEILKPQPRMLIFRRHVA
jgi:ubiquinone/menaquinone biosynthesis C-methylase UbiE